MLRASAAVALGSAAGGVLRFWLSVAAERIWPQGLPIGTIAVNVAGSFAIGLIAAMTISRPDSLGGPLGHQALMAGLLGGFTTFSAFSLQTLLLAQDGRWGLAVVNVVASIALCLLAVAAGWNLGRTV